MHTNANTYATIIFTFALLLAARNISATTWNAATANQSDVSAAILQAADGDTVVVPDTLSLPGGAAIWTSRINVTVGLLLKVKQRSPGRARLLLSSEASNKPSSFVKIFTFFRADPVKEPALHWDLHGVRTLTPDLDLECCHGFGFSTLQEAQFTDRK